MSTTTYKIDYKWNGGITHVRGVISEEGLREVKENPRHVIVSCEPYEPKIMYQTAEGCARCVTDEYVPHYNCRCRAQRPHCTADSCY